MKRSVVFLMMVVLTATVWAGGSKETATSVAEKSVDLHVYHFKVNLLDEWNGFTADYAAIHPDITFTNEIVGGGTQWMQVLKTKFAAGKGPDIFVVEGPSQYDVFRDYVVPQNGAAWIDRAAPFARDGLNVNGEFMGMPVNLEGYGYIYNKAIFREAGITQVPRTLAELRSAAEKIKAKGYTPFATGYGEWWVMGMHLMNIPFARQADPQAFIEALNTGKVKMSETPEFKALQQLIDLNVEFGERNPLTTNNLSQVEKFVNGEVAMIQQGNWKEKDILSVNPDAEIGLLPIPLGNDPQEGDRIAIGVPFYFVVNGEASQQTQDEALAFLDYLVSADVGSQYLVEDFGFIPAYADIEPVGLGGISRDIIKYAAADKAIPWMFGQFPDGMPNEFADLIQAYIAGRNSWQTTLTMMDAAWQRLKQ
ncbi:MAG: ABC transporter substrate-binding protein [Spirochaetota bacterium]